MIIVNAENAVFGRMAAVVAKKALLGETVAIVNCEKAVFSGSMALVCGKYLHNKKRGGPRKGPFYSSDPMKFSKRVLRGMLPHKETKGQEAFKRIKFYVGVPSEFAGKETVQYGVRDLKINYVTVAAVCKFIGGRQ